MLVTLLLCAMLAGLVAGAVAGTARSAGGQQRALNRERIGSTVSAWWRTVLWDAEGSDVEVPSSAAINASLPVGVGSPCALLADTIFIARTEWSGERDPEAGRDQLWLLRDAAIGVWDDGTLLTVGSGRCPDGTAALRLLLASPSGAVQLVRVLEPIQLRIYRSSGVGWFGQAPADGSSPVQPTAGPVEFTTSQFTRDSSGVHVFLQPTVGPGLWLNAPLGVP